MNLNLPLPMQGDRTCLGSTFLGNLLKGVKEALERPTNVLDVLVGGRNAFGKGVQADGELQSKAGKLDYGSDEADLGHDS